MAKKKPAPKARDYSIDDLLAEGMTYTPQASEPDTSAAPEEPKGRSGWGIAKDVGISALKGAIGVPEAAVGLADLVTGGRAGKLAEEAGFRPKEAKAMLDEGYSPEQKEAFRKVQAAEGVGDTFFEAVSNPSVIPHAVIESLPSMGAGGVLARGGLAVAPKMAGWAAGAMGEGVIGAGSAAEQIRQQTPDGLLTGQQAGLGAVTGLATAGFGMLGGKIAQRLGIADVDTMFAGAATNPALRKGVVRSALEGAFSEGILEELPQSVSEQVLQNVALGKPLDEGIDQAIVMGALTGGAMGAGANVVNSFKGTPPPVTPPAGPLSRAATLALPAPVITVSPTGEALTAEDRSYQMQPRGSMAESGIMGMGRESDDITDVVPRDIPPAPPVEPPAPRAERRNTDAVNLDLPTDPVQNYVNDLRTVNTPAAKLYVRDFDAGTITAADVAERMAREAGPTTDQRIERAAAQAPSGEVQPGDILNPKGQPFKTRFPADRTAREQGGSVIAVAGGYAVRKGTDTAKEQDDQSQAPAARAPAAAQAQAAPPAAAGDKAPATARTAPAAATAGLPAVTGSANVEAAGLERRAKLLDSMDNLKGTNRKNAIQYKIDGLNESIANNQKVVADPSLIQGMMPKSVKYYSDEIKKLQAEKADLEAILPEASDRDGKDQIKDTNRFFLQSSKQELDAAVSSGQMTQAQADAAVKAARQTGNAVDASETIYEKVDKANAAPLAAAGLPGAAQPADIKAITAKQIPDMSDDEIRQAITHYGPDHKRTAKLQAALDKRPATPNPGATNEPQTPQAIEASPQGQAAPSVRERIEAVNAKFKDIQRRHGTAWFTGDGPTRKLRADAPQDVKDEWDAYLADKQGVQAEIDTADEAPVSDDNDQWQRTTTAEREGMAVRAGVTPLVAKNLATRPWKQIRPATRRKLLAMMEPAPADTTRPAGAPTVTAAQAEDDGFKNEIGGKAFKEGKKRAPPDYLSPRQQTAWSAGWDDAAKASEAPAAPVNGNFTTSAADQRAEAAAAEKKRRQPAVNGRGSAWKANPFKAFIGKHGISLAIVREFAPGPTEQRAAMVQGFGPIFRKSGLQIDELATRAVEEGFLLDEGEIEKLEDMIQRVLKGERIIPVYAEGVAEDEMEQRIRRLKAEYDDELAGMTDEDFDRASQDEADAEALLRELPDATLFELSDDETLFGDRVALNENTGENDYEESQGRPSSQGAAETDAGKAPGTAGQGNDAPGTGLTSPSQQEVIQAQERADKAERAAKAKKKADDEIARRERERRDIANASTSAADTFELGGNAEQNLSGQQDVFGNPAPAAAPARAEPNLQAARDLIEEAKRATGNNIAEIKIRRKVRDLAAKTPLSDEKTVLALDIIATRMGMGEGRLAGLEYADEPAPAAAPAADPTLDDELKDALGFLGDVLGDVLGGKLNMVPGKHTAGDLLPALSKVVELLIRKGFRSFKDATSKAAQLMRADPRTADHIDGITARQWKAAYNAVADSQDDTDSEDTVFNTSADTVKGYTSATPAPAWQDKVLKSVKGEAPGTEFHLVAKRGESFAVLIMDTDSGEYMPLLQSFSGPDALAKAEAYFSRVAPKAPAEAGSIKSMSESMLAAIRAGNMPKDNRALKMMVEAFDNGKAADPARMKQGQEALETAIVMASREVVAKKEGDRSTFDVLLRLYESQPNLNIRTSTSIANQAYSTPAPLAFLASRLAGITNATVAHEPTAGNGMLLIGADPAKAVVNELNGDRLDSLKSQGFRPTQRDAAKESLVPAGTTIDSVITNPPFGSVKDANDKPVKVKVDGYSIGQIDHLIAANALAKMKDDGRATLILGANKVASGQSTDDRIFFNWLYTHYNVAGHFEIEGDLYTRQGASWPVRVITIDGRKATPTPATLSDTIVRVDNWDGVYTQYTQSLKGSNVQTSISTNPAGNPAGNPAPASGATPSPSSGRGPRSGTGSTGNVPGTRPGVVPNSQGTNPEPVAPGADEQRLNAQPDGPEPARDPRPSSGNGPAKPAGAAALDAPSDEPNEFQAPYVPRSARKDEGVLIPSNMADPLQNALSRLEDEVGDIDEYARAELGYDSVEALHKALMGLQVDSVAMAIWQMKNDKAVVIADQTGIGKGRQAAAIIRWAARNGHTPVFVSVKPTLFTDMYGDLHDIGTDDIAPFIMNANGWIGGPTPGSKLFANKAKTHSAAIDKIIEDGTLPAGRNAVFMTYSQINKANRQRTALTALAPNAVFVLDESHNAAGESATGSFVVSTLGQAKGVTYLSATYAKRPDNMPLYFKTDIGAAAADTDGLAAAMASGGLPLQTVVSNNLVKAGQMFRRERSYNGVSIETKIDSSKRVEHEEMSDKATTALRAIVSADRAFHEGFVKTLKDELKLEGGTVTDSAGNQLEKGINHTEFSSVVHNFVKQMLLGLKAQTAADEAIAALKRGEKPIIAVENTMGSFLKEYAENNMLRPGDSLGAFDYRTVLTRALERSRVIIEVTPTGDKIRRPITLDQLDASTRAMYDEAQAVIDGLDLDIPVSPIDWMRNEMTKAGYSVAEITGRALSVDYSNPGKPVLSSIDAQEQNDKVETTRRFNSGKLDALVLNVAGSTGISLHASEKFTDQRQRYMIVAQPAGDINIFMQMLGRIHRTGQVVLPKYGILSVDLPTEKRPTAVLSVKMKSLNANTSSNTESATSVKSMDILNKYGDQIVAQFLQDNFRLSMELGLFGELADGDGVAADDLARKATGRLALQPIAVQKAFYEEVEAQYTALIDYLNKTNQNDLVPRTYDYDAKELRQEVLFEGPNKETPFGEDAIYGEYSIKAQGIPMKPAEIEKAMAESLDGKKPAEHVEAVIDGLLDRWVKQINADRAKHGLEPGNFNEAKFRAHMESIYGKDEAGFWVDRAKTAIAKGGQVEDVTVDQMRRAQGVSAGMEFMRAHAIGKTFRVDINSETYNAIVTNIRNTHKETGNPFSLSKIQVAVSVNGALRNISVPATQFKKIEVSSIQGGYRVDQLFKEQPANQRETAKIVTGNLLAAYGEISGARGTIISFTREDGTIEQGILLPKLFDFKNNTKGDYRLPSGAAAVKFLQQSVNRDIGRFGIMSRDSVVRVLPAGQGIKIQVPKSKAKGGKYFLDKKLIEAGGADFVTAGNFMTQTVYDPAQAAGTLDLLVKKSALYALPSMADEAKAMSESGDAPKFSRSKPGLRAAPDAQAKAVASVQKHVDALAAGWSNAPKIVVAYDMQDARIPERVRQEDQKQRSQGATGTPEGFYYGGTVYVMASQVSSLKDTARVLFHETLGHAGLRGTFGKSLNSILTQIVTMRRAEVNAKAKEYGLDMTNEGDRLTAAEEVLAVMAQTTPKLGFVQRAIAAIRTWLRGNVPALEKLALSDAEIIRSFILPARRFIENGPAGPGGGKAPAAPSRATPAGTGPVFSRTKDLAGALAGAMNNAREVKLPAGYLVGDFFNSAGKLSWWHKSVGTMYNTAQRHPRFKKVYDGVQDFLNDVSLYATEAADLAPNILPKLDTWKDITKTALSPADNKAIAAPIFEGTLTWGRDEAGRPVKMAVLEAKAAKLNTAQKAQELLRKDKISESLLKMWQGLPVDQYETMVEGRYESEILKAGIVFTPAELKGLFKLTDGQVNLYKEFRAAIDKSLTTLALSDMVRYGGSDVAPIKDMVMASKSVQDAAETLRDYLMSLSTGAGKSRANVLIDMANKMVEKSDKARDLMKRGYAPLSRFGTHSLDVVDTKGERVYFGLFESKADAAKMARQMQADYPGAAIKQGTTSEEAYKLFAGVSPETLELFGEMLGLENEGTDAASQAFQEYLKLARSSRSAMKRLIQRKGIAGFNEDPGRVLAGFIYSNARQTSGGLHMGDISQAVNEIPQGQGELKDAAMKLADYIKNPQEEAQKMRGLLFAQYLGGSVASAMVNMTQPLTVTFPYLSQFGGAIKAAARMKGALADVMKDSTGNKELDAALKLAEEKGIVAPQEVHQLMAQANGSGSLKSGDGTQLGNATAAAGNYLAKLGLVWGKLFSSAEQFNRRVTFIAAYRTAKEQGIANPADFAAKVIAETQFTYNKGSKPRWARGAVGGTLFTFKQYSVNYVELVHRMATQGGPDGQRAALLMMAVLFLIGGAGGLPFAEDAEDIADGIAQRLGYNFSAKQKRNEFVAGVLGKDAARFLDSGISGLPGVPIDLSGRMGMGNLIPATGLFTKKQDYSRDILEVVGPAGDLAKRVLQSANALAAGEVAGAGKFLLPVAGRNLAQAVDMGITGMYRDQTGKKVLDVDGYDALVKGIGFQPNSVARVQDANRTVQNMIAQNKLKESELADRWAIGIFEGKPEKVKAVREAIQQWNIDNPSAPIKIALPQVLKRVKAMRSSKTERIAKTAPKEIRATVRRELAEE